MAVRNFYIKARADGRASSVGIGPGAKDGGLWATITQRDEGSIATVAEIRAGVTTDGRLWLEIEATREGMDHYAPYASDRPVMRFETKR